VGLCQTGKMGSVFGFSAALTWHLRELGQGKNRSATELTTGPDRRNRAAVLAAVIDLYAADELSEAAYVDGNVALDQELHRLRAKRAALLPFLHDADAVGASICDFCESERRKLNRCAFRLFQYPTFPETQIDPR
jgi:hypothetical protein